MIVEIADTYGPVLKVVRFEKGAVKIRDAGEFLPYCFIAFVLFYGKNLEKQLVQLVIIVHS